MVDTKTKQGNQFFLFTILYIIMFGVITVPLTVVILYYALDYSYGDMDLNAIMMYSTVFMTMVPVFLYFLVFKEKFSDVIQIKAVSIKNLILITLICFSVQPVMSFLAVIGTMFSFSESSVSEIVNDLMEAPYIYSLLAIAVFPAIFEELLMRGVVLKKYEHLPLKKMAIVNGLFFGIMHLTTEQFFYATLLGFLFVYFYKLTGSILSAIYAHFIINGTQITLSYLYKDSVLIEEVSSSIFAELLTTFILAIPFTAITFLLFKAFVKMNTKKSDIDLITDEIESNTESDIVAISNEIKSDKVVEPFFIAILVVYFIYMFINFIGNLLVYLSNF